MSKMHPMSPNVLDALANGEMVVSWRIVPGGGYANSKSMAQEIVALRKALKEGFDRLEANHVARDLCPDSDHEWMHEVMKLTCMHSQMNRAGVK